MSSVYAQSFDGTLVRMINKVKFDEFLPMLVDLETPNYENLLDLLYSSSDW
jgi:hypothetical protein